VESLSKDGGSTFTAEMDHKSGHSEDSLTAGWDGGGVIMPFQRSYAGNGQIDNQDLAEYVPTRGLQRINPIAQT
jgi:hypothetical protein